MFWFGFVCGAALVMWTLVERHRRDNEALSGYMGAVMANQRMLSQYLRVTSRSKATNFKCGDCGSTTICTDVVTPFLLPGSHN